MIIRNKIVVCKLKKSAFDAGAKEEGSGFQMIVIVGWETFRPTTSSLDMYFPGSGKAYWGCLGVLKVGYSCFFLVATCGNI